MWLRAGTTLLKVTHTLEEQSKATDEIRDGALQAARQALANLP
ncbi:MULTISPECIES: hypothetical protein [unclassified Nonomuraea]|nr:MULTISPECIES: hypothetical protein [unclassified Nonomuraea]